MVRTYRVSSIFARIAALGGLAAMMAGGAWVLATQHELHLLVWGVVWCLGIAVAWWFVLFDYPYKIRLSDEGTCEFRSLLRTRRLRAHGILSMTGRELDEGGREAVVRYEGGDFSVPEFDGLADFLTQLQALNPAIQMDRKLLSKGRTEAGELRWHCDRCGWTAEGPWRDVIKTAALHRKSCPRS